MKKTVTAKILKGLKISGIVILFLLGVMFVLPLLFPDYITEKVKKFANEKLNGELHFTDAHLSFFNHFPSLTLTLDDFLLKGSEPFKKDTLVAAKEVSFGINVMSLITSRKVNIDKIFISNSFINVKVNANGEANYNVYVSDAETKTEADSSSASIRLEKIDISNAHLIYHDQSTKMLINAKGFDYIGKGDLDKSIFDLYTRAKIESFDFTFDGEHYLKNKKVDARLVTKINTNSLAFIFEKNNLKINRLPVEFTGKLDFLKNGYDLDFLVQSQDSKLNDFFTALPPQYVQWLEKTNIQGKTDLLFSLKGKYIASQNLKPDVHFNMKVRKGYISYDKSPFPAEHIFLNFDTKLPSLDTEKLAVTIDSIYFDVGKDFFNGNVKWEGLQTPKIDARIRSQLDLAKLNRALGLQNLELKGLFKADIVSKGNYDKSKKVFPVTKGALSLQNGWLKTAYYPNPIKNIGIDAQLHNSAGNLKDLKVKLHPVSFDFEGQPFHLTADFQDFEDIQYDLKAKGELDIARIYKVFSQKGLELEGYAKINVAFKGKQSDATNGRYTQLNNKGTMELRNIKTTSEYLPKPFVINEGVFQFNQDKMSFTNFKATYGKSDFLMNGYMENVINFALSDNAVLKGDFALNSNFIDVDEFMSQQAATAEVVVKKESVTVSKPIEAGVVQIPKNFNLNLRASMQKVHFDGLQLHQLNGTVGVNSGKLHLRNTRFELVGTKVLMNALYADESSRLANFQFDIKAQDFDIKRAYREVKMFREMASAAESAEGIVSLDYKVNGKLDHTMSPVYPSLQGGGVLSVKQVKMKGFKLFNAVSKKTETTALKDPDVTKVDIKTTVKNNIITIERFKFKVAGFRPRIEGQTSLDGKLNIKMRLGLPPLGIIGIPMKVTGTQDSPKVSLGNKTEDLEETEYDEGEMPPAAVKDSIAP